MLTNPPRSKYDARRWPNGARLSCKSRRHAGKCNPWLHAGGYDKRRAAQQGTNSAPQAEGMNPGAAQQGAVPGAMPAAAIATPQRARFQTASVLSARPQPFSRSPELSDRLTRIARNRDMLVGKGINVYMSNDVALVQGTVRTPADSDALASVLVLEPDVEHIDNRLSVAAAGN